ncbi:type IV pilus assembly protein PilA [Ureibacillus xyleni]|uniref:Type IV pilus assembly protein PilA n=1 Tax=Ureibacillus xyleni TaxID=614648 RepID=A0A285SXP8_9BACL|nr:prepilin-type N-terminal cleavage/methylation domain-containing protein [Ureibacillus xyleni]SOC13282.1 type IV pilus assembly protein PilA [Ureibacillus xyleni]
MKINRMKNEKGLTLIELLAVIVVLGIIAAIAIPAIGNIIENTKKDAHIANAKAMIEATRLLSIEESDVRPSVGNKSFIPLGYLINKGYMDAFDSHGFEMYAQNPDDNPTKNGGPHHMWENEWNTFVQVVNNNGIIEYSVKLLLTPSKEVVLPLTKESEITRDKITHYN